MVVLRFFNVHPYLGKWSNLTNIFQMGWNHQPVEVFKMFFVVFFRPNTSDPQQSPPCHYQGPVPAIGTFGPLGLVWRWDWIWIGLWGMCVGVGLWNPKTWASLGFFNYFCCWCSSLVGGKLAMLARLVKGLRWVFRYPNNNMPSQ